MRPLLRAVVLLLLAACVAPAPPPLEGPDAFEAAAAQERDPSRRASIYLAARAERARRHGDPDAARRDAEQALRVDERNPYAYLALGRALRDLGDRTGALKMARAAESAFGALPLVDPAWVERASLLREGLERSEEPLLAPDGRMLRAPPGTGAGRVVETRP